MPVLFILAQNQYLSIIIVYQFNVILIPTLKKVLLVINFFIFFLRFRAGLHLLEINLILSYG